MLFDLYNILYNVLHLTQLDSILEEYQAIKF